MKPLSEMPIGSSSFVSKILGSREDYHRIIDMGIEEGVKIEVEDNIDNVVFYLRVDKAKSMILLKKDCDLIIMEEEEKRRTEHFPFLMPLWPGFGFGYGRF